MQTLITSQYTTQEIIDRAIEILSQGGILIYPTETTYGLGVDATNQKAVDKLLNYKEKREGKALSVAVSSIEMAERYVEINSTARNIYDKFLPGPVTVISKSRGLVANGVASEQGTIGIRIPDYDLMLSLIQQFDRGITATSANASNKKRPYCINDILENISERQKSLIDLIIDAGELPHNNPSTVIDTVTGVIETIRLGDNRFDLEKNITTNTPEETIALGKLLGEYVANKNKTKATVIAIQGDLGAGKTHFASGVAKGLNIDVPVKSPTFILANEYDSLPGQKFYHIDTYRMNDENELLDIGFEEMLSQPNVILIEWANRVIPVLDKYKDDADFIWLRFDIDGEDRRSIYHNLDIY